MSPVADSRTAAAASAGKGKVAAGDVERDRDHVADDRDREAAAADAVAGAARLRGNVHLAELQVDAGLLLEQALARGADVRGCVALAAHTRQEVRACHLAQGT